MASYSPKDIVRAGAQGVSVHAIVQLVARLVTFGIKAFTIRKLGPERFAFTEIRLALLVSVATLPARTGFRKLAVRAQEVETAVVLAVAGVMVTAGLGVCGGLIAWWVGGFTNGRAIGLMVVGSVVESSAEVGWVLAVRRQKYARAAQVRAGAVVVGNIFSMACVVALPNTWAVLANTCGEFVQRLCLAIGMNSKIGGGVGGWSIGRKVLREGGLGVVGGEVMSALTSAVQSFCGFILTSGEDLVLDATCDGMVKGSYKLAGNIGSLVARCFSEALEEQTFNIFSTLGSSFRERKFSSKGGARASAEKDERARGERQACQYAWTLAMRSAILISLTVCVIGPAYTEAFINLLYGFKYKSAVPYLDHYFKYLLFMSINGIAESFVSAIATSTELFQYSVFSIVLSLFYLLIAFLLTVRAGPRGLIVANCFNMACRIVYSLVFYSSVTQKRPSASVEKRKVLSRRSVLATLGDPRLLENLASSLGVLKETLPKLSIVFALIVARLFGNMSKFLLGDQWSVMRIIVHGLSGVVALMIVGVTVYLFDFEYVNQMRDISSVPAGSGFDRKKE